MKHHMLPEYIEVETTEAPIHSIIWLHGLGADGADFSDLPRMLQLPAQSAIRFLFPHAPMRSITLNGGMRMRGWYDLQEMPQKCRSDLIHFVLKQKVMPNQLFRRLSPFQN